MSSHAVPASDQLLQELRQLLSEVLDADISAVDPELPLLDLITSSLAMVDGMRRVYDRFGVLISLRQLIEAQTTLGMLALQIQSELEKRRAEPAAAKVVSPAPGRPAEPLPLPAAQQHVAFLSRYMAQAAAAYNLAVRLQLSGPLEPTALRHALQTLVTQNEALRLALNPERDEFLLLAADEPVLLPLTETSATTLQPLIAELINEPFAPGEALFRAALLQIGPERHELLLVTHALVLDEAALARLTGALGALYSAQLRDEPPVTVGAPLSWRQYQVLADGDAVSGQRAAAAAYYHELLPTGVPRLDLPAEQARPPVKRYEGATYRLPLREIADSALQNMAARLKLSPPTLIAGALTLWLHRLSRQSDFLLGLDSGPRFLAEGQMAGANCRDLIGLRSHYQPDESFDAWLGRFGGMVATGRSHSALSSSELVQMLNLPRDQSRSAPFTAVIRQLPALPAPQFTGLTAEPAPLPWARARHDLEFLLLPVADGYELHCEYSSELFQEETIAVWLEGWQALLAAGLADPDELVSTLPMLSVPWRRQVLKGWNETECQLPPRTVLDGIAEGSHGASEAIAIRHETGQLSYGQLWSRSSAIAAALVADGVGAGDRVGLLLGRNLDLLPAMLAVWRVGAAYVPLDPAFPAERLQYMHDDAALKAVLTTAAQSHLLPEARQLFLEQVATSGDDFVPAVQVDPGQIAYIMYTSGSTGRPKGVVITHANLLNYMLAAQAKLQLGPGVNFLALTTISFDISATELLLPLLFGATVDLGAEHLAMDGVALLERLQSAPPSHLQATPSTWKLLLAAGWTGSPELTMLAIGEKMERRLAEALLARGQTLWNFYGPTETTIASTGVCLEAAPELPVPIGKPLRNTQIYLLDSALQPVPPGATGDLYIGGLGVADGYWHRPELTAARFLANPFRPGERIYRTGDLARQDLHGELFYLGRDDDQVKIHGIRVELGEVEQALQRTAAVRDVVVTTWQDNHGDIQLVAHVIAAAAEANVTMVREQARAFLPEAMVPPFILFTEAFPLSANGKVRRSALPAPRADAEPAAQPLLAPQTPTEKLLAEAWAEVLDLEVGQIGRDANFLEIGGHSLAMTPLMLAIRRRFHVDFRLAELFEALTVQSFARLIDERRRSRNGQDRPRDTAQQRRTEAYGRQRMAYLRQEGELPAHIAPARGQFYRPAGPYRHVLLTGATGFLGVYIVAEILAQTDATLYCLVRPKKGAEARQRIEQQMRHYDVWQEDEVWQAQWRHRVQVLEGDVTLPLLGLAERQYEQLSHEIDAILHSAAHVNFIYPYEALRATNVLGLHEVMRFAFQGQIKPVHHLSTAAIWPMGSHFTFYEKDTIEHNQLLNLGYDEAKWVGEQCLLNAAERGLPVVRYRPGEVGGDSVTGRCVTDHFLFASIKGYLQHGAFPTLDIEVDVAPVDYVAKALVFLMFNRQPIGRAFHLTNPKRRHMSDALTFLRSLGYQFAELRFETLRDQLLQSDNFASNALFAYQSVLEEMDDISLQLPIYDTRLAERFLQGSGISCPPADEKLFMTYVDYLRRIGFLPEPISTMSR